MEREYRRSRFFGRSATLPLVLFAGVATIVGCARPPRSEVRLVRTPSVDTAAMTQEIERSIKETESLRTSSITAAIRENVVSLVGETESEENRRVAEEIARRIAPDLPVANGIAILPPEGDEAVSRNVRAALARNATPIADAIEVSTRDHVVTLSGTLDNPDLVEQILSVARNVQGVKEVRNEFILEQEMAMPRSFDETSRGSTAAGSIEAGGESNAVDGAALMYEPPLENRY